ncbi:DNA-3-methyladenine glycosylase III [Marininema mesophilum]|uniref:DNA-3-methyladenine glycosylase III n=1 Tax=Marininema mesophilum TaxID=1048340 RepID=A0A1H2QJM9_9BACL|nr:hypothetical protein [Marininema mesophilum]SDW07275.1 DNA-3-methyladenine glycosylase III [Marininema mesophilum]
MEIGKWTSLYRRLREWKPDWSTQDWWGRTDPFEKAWGSILVQNTTWNHAARALDNMRESRFIQPEDILQGDEHRLQETVRPAGFYRAKSQAIRGLATWFIAKGHIDHDGSDQVLDLRRDLLSIRGIGPETADMILLYVLKRPSFMGDAYTRRIISRYDEETLSYEEVRQGVLLELPNVVDLQLLHALLVEMGKEHCQKRRPRCEGCPCEQSCVYYRNKQAKESGEHKDPYR